MGGLSPLTPSLGTPVWGSNSPTLRCIRPYLELHIAKTIATSIVHPKLDYCNLMYYGVPKYQMNRLQHIQHPTWAHNNVVFDLIWFALRIQSIPTICTSWPHQPYHSYHSSPCSFPTFLIPFIPLLTACISRGALAAFVAEFVVPQNVKLIHFVEAHKCSIM